LIERDYHQQAAQILTGDDIGLKVMRIANGRAEVVLLVRIDGAWLAADLVAPYSP